MVKEPRGLQLAAEKTQYLVSEQRDTCKKDIALNPGQSDSAAIAGFI
ncbi:hypothetical protein CKAH01_14056 [Colletotrichum kahawae]|uniref:Uncharacterized protein n=1 Tax=Colletotrichum kahawae TaxID=34407 RepID=A0AAE0DA82_COLKA|nr:hypothetical protein CKAH01_14056 [Colletotrichum kahawae]